MARDLGVEFGAVYRITGPDGTVAVFNDPTSPYYVGVLEGDDAVTGLERAGVRENAENLTEADGGRHGSFYRERLPFTLKGLVDLTAHSAGTPAQSRILRATNALRRDALLEWWPSSISEGVRVAFREQQPTRITGRRPRSFVIAGVSEDPFAYSRTLRAGARAPGALSDIGGFVNPFSNPFTNVVAPGGQLLALNDGNADAWPVLYVRGPLLNPTVTNLTTGEALVLNYNLAAGEYLVIDTHPRRRTIMAGSAILADPTNELAHPDAAYGLTGWAALTVGVAGTVAVATIDGAPVFSAQYNAVAGSGGSIVSHASAATVPAGGTATLAAEVLVPVGSAITGQVALSDLTQITGRTLVSQATADANVEGVWQPVNVVYRNDAAGAVARTFALAAGVVGTAPSGGIFYFRRPRVHIDQDPGEYFTGDSAGYAWEGTPGASRSRRRSFDPLLLGNRRRALVFALSRWPRLAPGLNDLRISTPSSGVGALLELESRDAWG